MTVYKVKSILIARMPRGENEYKTATIKLFNTNSPHRKNVLPDKQLDFPSTRKVIIEKLTVEYLTEGNDLVVNNLEEIDILEPDTITVVVRGKQTD